MAPAIESDEQQYGRLASAVFERLGAPPGLIDCYEEDELREALMAERERIAEEIRRGTIHDIFGVGLRLQSLAQRLSSPQRDEVERAVRELDGTIAALRGRIFGLRHEDERHDTRHGQLRALASQVRGA